MNQHTIFRKFMWLRKSFRGFLVWLLIPLLGGGGACKSPDSLYEEHIVPNGTYYPAKAINAEAFTGKERIEIAWTNGADPKVVKARISWNNDSESVEVDVPAGAERISRIIELPENTYSFIIRTYDANGNTSVPVEVFGNVYGAKYERTLTNRSVKSAVFNKDDGSFLIRWAAADATETGINLTYTDTNDQSRTVRIDPSDTETIITGFKSGKPAYYATMHKPAPTAIDDFNAASVKIPYSADLSHLLTYTVGEQANFRTDRYHILGWTTNFQENAPLRLRPADGNWYFAIVGIETGHGPIWPLTNGKLYKSVELEAGTYRFSACSPLYNTHYGGSCELYIAAALGNGLPDTGNIGSALGSASIPETGAWVEQSYSFEFTLSAKSTVSLGFVANMRQAEAYIRKVELSLEM